MTNLFESKFPDTSGTIIPLDVRLTCVHIVANLRENPQMPFNPDSDKLGTWVRNISK